MKQIVLCCYCYSNEKLFNKYFNGFFLGKKGHRAPFCCVTKLFSDT